MRMSMIVARVEEEGTVPGGVKRDKANGGVGAKTTHPAELAARMAGMTRPAGLRTRTTAKKAIAGSALAEPRARRLAALALASVIKSFGRRRIQMTM